MQGYLNTQPRALVYPTFVKETLDDLRWVGQRVVECGDHYETIQPDGSVVRMLKE